MISLMKKFRSYQKNVQFAEFKLDPLEEEFMRIGRIMNLEIDLQLQEIY